MFGACFATLTFLRAQAVRGSGQSPSQASSCLGTGTLGLPSDFGQVPSIPKDGRAAGAEAGPKWPLFSPRCPTPPAPGSLRPPALSAMGPGCNPCWGSAPTSPCCTRGIHIRGGFPHWWEGSGASRASYSYGIKLCAKILPPLPVPGVGSMASTQEGRQAERG